MVSSSASPGIMNVHSPVNERSFTPLEANVLFAAGGIGCLLFSRGEREEQGLRAALYRILGVAVPALAVPLVLTVLVAP